MKINICPLQLIIVTFFLLIGNAAQANEVTIPYKGLVLNANLKFADNKNLSDGIIIITHGGLMYRGMELYTHLQQLFKEHGYSSLAINLSLGINNRRGRFDCKTTQRHRYSDAANEIGAWVAWLKGQGVHRIVLLGHSRGGAETALYASAHDDQTVKAVVLLAPDTQETNNAKAYQDHYGAPLASVLAKAQRLVKESKGDIVMPHTHFLHCADSPVSATTFVSYYSPDPRLDTAYLIPKIKKKTLIVLAGSDEIVINDKKFYSLESLKHVQVKAIDDAGHFFRDLFADDAVDTISEFLKNNNVFSD